MKQLLYLIMLTMCIPVFAQETETLIKNSDDSEYITIPLNISFFPGFSIGESVAQGKKIKNNISINLLAGSAAKLEGVEWGGLVNIYTEDVLGAQWAGLLNITGTDVTGGQWAGLCNISGGDVLGGQWAGLCNVSGGTFVGGQWAGLCNVNGGDVTAGQWAGIANVNGGEVVGGQWAGIANVQKSFTGAQWAGIANITEEFEGVQFAGIINLTEKFKAGVQVATVNISDENEGIPIGLVSYVKSVGFHYDLWTDETMFINAGLRSGTESFHNLLFIGIQAKDTLRYTMGVAFGGHISLGEDFYLEPDLGWHYIKEESDIFWSETSDNLVRIRLLAGWQVAEFMSLYAGPTFNYYISKYRDGEDLFSSSISDGKSGKYWTRSWIGFSAGVRF
ncbi:hypothetical protein ACFLSQ_05510 [Bacteroidota bacterium]